MANGNVKQERRGTRRTRVARALSAAAVFGLVVAALSMPQGAGSFPLESASLTSTSTQATLRLQSDASGAVLPHEVFYLENPNRVVVDVLGADAPAPVQTPANGLVRDVRTSIWRDDPSGRIVRYVLETKTACDYWMDDDGNGLTLHLQSAKPGSSGGMRADAGSAPSNPAAMDAKQTSGAVNEPGDLWSAAVSEEFSTATTQAMSNTPLVAPSATQSSMAAGASVNADFWSMPEPAAQEDAAPMLPGGVDPRDASHAPAPGMEPAMLSAKSMMMQTEPMNLDVQDAEMRTVFRSIAEFGGTNVVPDRDVVGPVSVRLRNVPWRQALDIVCESASLIALDGDGVIRVATLKTFNDERLAMESTNRKRDEVAPLETHVFIAGYASARDLVEPVALVLSDRGTANADARTNSVVVTDIASRIAEVSKLIRSLDSETQQVEITARLVDIDATANRQLGITWSAENLSNVSEGLFGDLSVDEQVPLPSGQLRFGLVRDWGNLDATLQALESTNNANIISNPKITTVNNHPARILVGREVPLITLDEAGNPVTELKKVGITLEVTPFINKDNKITMDLHPEISDLSSQATVQGGLIFNTTEADTRIMVDNGQTAVIGGLIRTNELTFEQGIPVLRSIPILGHLFKFEDKRVEKRELLIFVTPRVVTDMASAG